LLGRSTTRPLGEPNEELHAMADVCRSLAQQLEARRDNRALFGKGARDRVHELADQVEDFANWPELNLYVYTVRRESVPSSNYRDLDKALRSLDPQTWQREVDLLDGFADAALMSELLGIAKRQVRRPDKVVHRTKKGKTRKNWPGAPLATISGRLDRQRHPLRSRRPLGSLLGNIDTDNMMAHEEKSGGRLNARQMRGRRREIDGKLIRLYAAMVLLKDIATQDEELVVLSYTLAVAAAGPQLRE
jgi:hypothetical protein